MERLSSFTRDIWRGRKRIRQRGMIRDRSAAASFRPSWPRVLRGDIKTIYIWHNLSRPRPDQRRSDSQRVTVIYNGTLRRHNGNKWLGRGLTSCKSCNETRGKRSCVSLYYRDTFDRGYFSWKDFLNLFKNLLLPLSNFNSLSCKFRNFSFLYLYVILKIRRDEILFNLLNSKKSFY